MLKGSGTHDDRSDPPINDLACSVLRLAERRGMTIATAESCTGGLLSSVLTDQPGLSKWFDRGFVVYTDEAKSALLGVSPEAIARHGAVSAQTASAMARGALDRSEAGVAVSITGFAGQAGPDDEAGLVFLSIVDRSGRHAERECHFGDAGRDETRDKAARVALRLLETRLQEEEASATSPHSAARSAP